MYEGGGMKSKTATRCGAHLAETGAGWSGGWFLGGRSTPLRLEQTTADQISPEKYPGEEGSAPC